MDKAASIEEAMELIEADDPYVRDAAAKQGCAVTEVSRNALVDLVADALFEDFCKGELGIVMESDTPEEAVTEAFNAVAERARK